MAYLDLAVPRQPLISASVTDVEAVRTGTESSCALAAFTAVFDAHVQNDLMVQLDDYARNNYDGNPWTLPAGASEF